jgi:hypothetical protein
MNQLEDYKQKVKTLTLENLRISWSFFYLSIINR